MRFATRSRSERLTQTCRCPGEPACHYPHSVYRRAAVPEMVAGHATPKQTETYDRDQVEAFRRTMKTRANYRPKNEP
jgi:hypothetical protein